MSQAQLVSGAKLDRFRLDHLLGKGSFGQVWLAVDEGDHGFRKQVALKVMSRTATDEAVEFLMREARINAALRHPNIVDCYGVMELEEACFIVMEFVEGETLAAMWRDLEFIGVPFPRSVILDVGIAVCEALHHAWSASDTDGRVLHIVHRDLKPANIMLSQRGQLKVADFGIAKLAEEGTLTRTGKVKGTPCYLAPELWTGGRNFTPAVDLWALGVILWEMCTLQRFFGKATVGKIFDLMCKRQPADEAMEVRDHFPALEPIIARLLQRDPDVRPQDPLTIAEELRRMRQELPPSGELVQFVRLVRAGRLEPDARAGSLLALPAIPSDASDWMPLVEILSADDGSPTTPKDSEGITTTRQLGPVDVPSLDDADFSLDDTDSNPDLDTESGDADPSRAEEDVPSASSPTIEGNKRSIPQSKQRGLDSRLSLLIIAILSLAVILLLLERVGIL